MWQTLQGLEKTHREFLQDFLDKTKCTVICELLQRENQHIVNLEHLEEPILKAITFTPTYSDVDFGSLVAIPPHHTLDFLSSLGFETPKYNVIPLKDMQTHRYKVRVLFCCNVMIVFTVFFSFKHKLCTGLRSNQGPQECKRNTSSQFKIAPSSSTLELCFTPSGHYIPYASLSKVSLRVLTFKSLENGNIPVTAFYQRAWVQLP